MHPVLRFSTLDKKKVKNLRFLKILIFFHFWSDLPKKINLLKIFFLDEIWKKYFQNSYSILRFLWKLWKNLYFFTFFSFFCHFLSFYACFYNNRHGFQNPKKMKKWQNFSKYCWHFQFSILLMDFAKKSKKKSKNLTNNTNLLTFTPPWLCYANISKSRKFVKKWQKMSNFSKYF